MNITKFLRNNILVIFLILLISSVMAYMNYQSMVEKNIDEGFNSDSNLKTIMYVVYGITALCLLPMLFLICKAIFNAVFN